MLSCRSMLDVSNALTVASEAGARLRGSPTSPAEEVTSLRRGEGRRDVKQALHEGDDPDRCRLSESQLNLG